MNRQPAAGADALVIENIGRGLFRVSYNGVCIDAPWYRIENAVKRIMRHYHDVLGVGR